MIFSHVLYQLSYLAQTKNPPEPPEARTGVCGEGPALPAPRSRPLERAPRISHGPKHRLPHTLSYELPYVGRAALRRRFTTIAGAGFEPATFGL